MHLKVFISTKNFFFFLIIKWHFLGKVWKVWSSLNPHHLSVCLTLSVSAHVFACCWAANKCVMCLVDRSCSVILRSPTGDFRCLVSLCCLTLTHLIRVMDSLHLRHNGLELATGRINIYLSVHSLLFLLSTFFTLEHATFSHCPHFPHLSSDVLCCKHQQPHLIGSFACHITYSSGGR